MSFINLLANDVWSDLDITNKTEAMIRAEFSVQAEMILNRKVVGNLTNSYELTEDDQAELARYKAVVEAARLEGIVARADMALLNKVFELEAADQRLKKPTVEPVIENEVVVNQADVDADSAERSVAQSVLDSATEDELSVFVLRNPVPVVEVPVEDATSPVETVSEEVSTQTAETAPEAPIAE